MDTKLFLELKHEIYESLKEVYILIYNDTFNLFFCEKEYEDKKDIRLNNIHNLLIYNHPTGHLMTQCIIHFNN